MPSGWRLLLEKTLPQCSKLLIHVPFALHRPINGLGLHPCIASTLQLACIYGLGVLMVLCAYAGYAVTACILEVLTELLCSLHAPKLCPDKPLSAFCMIPACVH